jgi:hypothetical protein
VRSPDWDPLLENSIRTTGPGHYLTCNIAYRRDAIAAIGGFREDVFKFAHGEDRELAARALRHGTIGFSEEMVVEHSPRRLKMKDVVRQAQWVRDDIALFAAHPELTREFRLPVRLALILGNSLQWIVWAAGGNRRSLSRWCWAVAASVVTAVVATWTAIAAPLAARLRRRSDLNKELD